MANLLRTAFPHLSDNQIKITVTGLFNLDQDIPAFKEHLRDFLVQIREYTGEDDSDLFLEEREGALKKAQDEKRKIQIAVPGILNPHEMPEEMQEMWAPEMEVRGTGKGNNTNRKMLDKLKKICQLSVCYKKKQLQTDCRNTGRANRQTGNWKFKNSRRKQKTCQLSECY